jgi:hypothetical protein
MLEDCSFLAVLGYFFSMFAAALHRSVHCVGWQGSGWPYKSVCCVQHRRRQEASKKRSTYLLRLVHVRAKSEFPKLTNWDQPAQGDNADRKHRPSKIPGGWAWEWQLHPEKCHKNWRRNSEPAYITSTWQMSKGLENWIMECSVIIKTWGPKTATTTVR